VIKEEIEEEAAWGALRVRTVQPAIVRWQGVRCGDGGVLWSYVEIEHGATAAPTQQILLCLLMLRATTHCL
jgi:hypothetical protein